MQWPGSGRKSENTSALPGVIETIGNAFALLNKRPFLLVVPMILDLFLWLGYRLSVEPLTDAFIRWSGSSASSDDASVHNLQKLGSTFNLFDILAIPTPSLVTGVGSDLVSNGATRAVATLPWWTLPPLIIVLAVVGLAVGVSYLTLLSGLVRERQLSIPNLVRASAINTVNTIGFILLVVGVAFLLLFPIMLLSGILLAFGISIIPLTSVLLFLGYIWAYVLLYFAQDAVVVSNAGPARAIYLSYNVVRTHFWPCIGLIVVSIVIQIGTPLALNVFMRSAFGVPLAFLIRAYVLTGLAVAALLFYRDRARLIRAPKAASLLADRSS
jgi:hypothetical protein